MSKLSIVMVVKNEADRLANALKSVLWADEMIVLVDAETTDNTAEIARTLGAKVYIESNPRGSGYIGFLRRLAQNHATSPWILALDADERVTKELAEEITAIVKKNDQTKAYAVPRITFFLDRFLHHTWRPDYVLRVFPKEHGQYDDKAIHEQVVLNPIIKVEHLKNDLEHYHCHDLHHFIGKIHRYAHIQAAELYAQGKKTTLMKTYMHTLATFGKNFFLKCGFLDGRAGLLVASLSAYSTFLKYAMVWAKRRRILAKKLFNDC
jgi:(heptosyl)LPS beta-1,4-glucosyltransferase